MKTKDVLVPALLALALCACNRAAAPDTAGTVAPEEPSTTGAMPATPPVEAPAGAAVPATEPPAAAPVLLAAPAAFVDKVWRVRESSAVAPSTRYSFLGDGTLVIEGAGGPPGYGRWAYANGALTMTEEGITYPVDILALDADGFEIRSNNPGEPVAIMLEADADATLPASPPK